MIGNDWTLCVDRWLKHPEWGFAAMLAQVPRRPGLAPIGAVKLLNDVEDPSCQKEYRPTGASEYLVIGSDRTDRPVKTGNRKTADRDDFIGLGLFYMSDIGDFGRALAQADPVLEAALASLRLLCDKGFLDTKVEPPTDRESWQVFGSVRVVELDDYTAVRLKATAQQSGAVPVAALFARLKGLRTTFEPTGVA